MPRRMLIVDDEAGIRNVLAAAFTRAAYQVTVAADAMEAMALCESGSYNVVLSDVLMPGKNGHELARWVATRHPSTHIILMSAFNDVEDEDCRIPSQPLLSKPFKPQDAVDRVENVFG